VVQHSLDSGADVLVGLPGLAHYLNRWIGWTVRAGVESTDRAWAELVQTLILHPMDILNHLVHISFICCELDRWSERLFRFELWSDENNEKYGF
jgi:hypothetical protein